MSKAESINLRIFTIVHSCADADKGLFPSPSVEGCYLSLAEAQSIMFKMVADEKENRDFHCDDEDYCEEYSDTHWEAYEDGYAAANFSRFEIVPSTLTCTSSKVRLQAS